MISDILLRANKPCWHRKQAPRNRVVIDSVQWCDTETFRTGLGRRVIQFWRSRISKLRMPLFRDESREGSGGQHADRNSKNKGFASKISDKVRTHLETELETILVLFWPTIHMTCLTVINIPDAFFVPALPLWEAELWRWQVNPAIEISRYWDWMLQAVAGVLLATLAMYIMRNGSKAEWRYLKNTLWHKRKWVQRCWQG